MNRAAAFADDSESGMGYAAEAGSTTRSASPPRGNGGPPSTRVPTATSAPSPTPITSPAISSPGVNGSGGLPHPRLTVVGQGRGPVHHLPDRLDRPASAGGAAVRRDAAGARRRGRGGRLGAEVAIDYLAEDFTDAVKAATNGRGADVIYDSVGGDTFDRSRKCIAFEGRIVVVGFAGGRIADAPTNHLLLKNYALVGLHWGLYRQFEPGLFAQIHAELMDLHARGAIDPLVYAELPLVEAPAALRRLAERGTWGKVVLRP